MGNELKRFSRWRPHPWHGLPVGPDPPGVLNAYIEITPFDLIKYEIDKESGYLRVDRLLRTSSLPPALYGFVPRTFCGTRVAALSERADCADHDPLDICVVTERPIRRSDMLVPARVLGALRTTDDGCADDKIIAILNDDPVWGDAEELEDLPPVLVQRLYHYFRTYKMTPDGSNQMDVFGEVGRDDAMEIVAAAMKDYQDVRDSASTDNARP